LPGARTRHEPSARHSSPHGGLMRFVAPLAAVAVGTRGGSGQGSGTMTIDPRSGTIETVTRTKSGEVIDTIIYTKSGGTIVTISYPKSGAHSGSGVTVVNPGAAPTPTPAPKRPGGAPPGGSGQGSGTSTVG
jgi:hypothetical protein